MNDGELIASACESFDPPRVAAVLLQEVVEALALDQIAHQVAPSIAQRSECVDLRYSKSLEAAQRHCFAYKCLDLRLAGVAREHFQRKHTPVDPIAYRPDLAAPARSEAVQRLVAGRQGSHP